MSVVFPGRLCHSRQMREMDRITIEEHGVPGLELMEAAGKATAEGIQELLSAPHCVVILCGPGNNGGDGFVVGRLLSEAGYEVKILLFAAAEKLSGDAKTNFERLPENVSLTKVTEEAWKAISTSISDCDCVVDGLLGTGLMRDVAGLYAKAIAVANAASALRIAIDIPSGLSSDTGQVLGTAFKAHHTFTYGEAKTGQMIYPGAELCGELHVVDIGIPDSVVESVGWDIDVLDQEAVRSFLPAMKADSHKGSFGHLLLVAGSPGKSGAAILAASGALRSGVGLITVACDAVTRSSLLAARPESMSIPSLRDDGSIDFNLLKQALKDRDALAIGPGWGVDESHYEVLRELLLFDSGFSAVIDADALTLLATYGYEFLKTIPSSFNRFILTPHPGEAARILGCSAAEIQNNRPSAARKLAEKTGATIILKGARTLVATGEDRLFLCPYGNPGMATGGAGDVLTGLIGSLLAQGLNAQNAALVGVVVHSLAGDLCAEKLGMRGMIAGDIAESIADVLRSWN